MGRARVRRETTAHGRFKLSHESVCGGRVLAPPTACSPVVLLGRLSIHSWRCVRKHACSTRGDAWRSVAKRGEAWRSPVARVRKRDGLCGGYLWRRMPVGIVLPASCAHPWAGRGMGGTRMWHSSSGGDSAPALLTQSRSVEILHVQPPDKTTTVADGPSCMASADSVTVSRMLTLRKLAARCRSGAP